MWVHDPELRLAVKASKLSPVYRLQRWRLASPAPSDVWLDDEQDAYLVAYEVQPLGHEDVSLCFTIEPTSFSVLESALIRMETTSDGWRVTHVPPEPDALSGGDSEPAASAAVPNHATRQEVRA